MALLLLRPRFPADSQIYRLAGPAYDIATSVRMSSEE
jgi:hypothetical protein